MPRRPHVRRLTQGPRPERAEHHGRHCRTSKEHPEQTLQLPHTAACPPIIAWYRGIWLLAATTGHVSLSCEPRMPKAHLGFLAFGVTYFDNLGHAASIKIMPIWPHCFSSNTSPNKTCLSVRARSWFSTGLAV